MAIKKDRGFVLKTFDFRETSKIAHIFTQNNGKIHGLFKGFSTGKKEFTTTLDTFSLNDFIFYESKNQLWLVSFADIVDSFSYLRQDLEKNLVANYIIELVDKITPLHQACPKIFNLLGESFLYLRDNFQRKILYIFQIRILELSGFQPHITACLKCSGEVQKQAFFSTKLGGFLCAGCAHNDRFSKELSAELISSLKYIQNNDFKIALRLSLSLKTERDLSEILEEFFSFHLDTRIKSLLTIPNS